MSEQRAPFISLGNHLKYVREQARQSLAEVSGAVEIDETSLARIEAGEERPSEDILLLLISHFNVHDTEALQLWELADYGGDVPEQIRPEIDIPTNGKPVVLLALDMRTQYSDGVDINVNTAGLTLNFTQAGVQSPTPVARVGMSLEQAEAVMRAMHHALIQARYLKNPKQLPPPNKADAQ
jgi:transcriptional regulator with XRE-family HTH domain